MNSAMKFGAASALALAGVAAHASISQPATGSSDAILFAEVVNAAGTAAVASYAGDTGISISTLEAGTTTTTVLGGDANLSKLFAADVAVDSVYFAVMGGQYTGLATPPKFATAGVAQFLTTTFGDSTNSLKNATATNLVKFSGINANVATINSNSGGANSVEGASPGTSGVWDITGGTTTLAYFDGGNVDTGNVIGNTQALFYLTGSGSTSSISYNEVETVSLSAAGLSIAAVGGSPPPAVPLPAAVWLLGSGLLGLTGVARRKLKA